MDLAVIISVDKEKNNNFRWKQIKQKWKKLGG